MIGFYFSSFYLFLYCVLFASLLSLKLWVLCLHVSPSQITVRQVTDDSRKFGDLQTEVTKTYETRSYQFQFAGYLGKIGNFYNSNRSRARLLSSWVIIFWEKKQ